MRTFGTRLREERLKLGLSQEEFAAVGGVARGAQANYESGERTPDAKYLVAVAELGVDLLYVLKGVRSSGDAGSGSAIEFVVNDDERDVIENYRLFNETGKAALHAFIASCINTASMLATATSRRAKRLPENRRAALDQRTAENVDRAVAELERLKVERATNAKKK